MMKKPELLAPAGDFEKLKTAIHYGADAVYFGDSRFSLRNKAGNFGPEELRNAVEYAHNPQKPLLSPFLCVSKIFVASAKNFKDHRKVDLKFKILNFKFKI